MTNEEFYKNELKEILKSIVTRCIGVDKQGVPCHCRDLSCGECILYEDGHLCKDAQEEWLKAEHVEPEQQVDWSKVKVDTPIYVRYGEEDEWEPRYFAKYENGMVYAWMNGGTSFSKEKEDVVDWNYAKLAESED